MNIKQQTARAALGLAMLCYSASTAGAIEILQLKQHVEVATDIVTLADIFPNARQYRRTALFKSPALGREGQVSIKHLIDAAERFGFTFETPVNLKSITVSRPARTIAVQDFNQKLEREIEKYITKSDDQTLTFKTDTPMKEQHVPLHFSGRIMLKSLHYDKSSKSFRAVFAPLETEARPELAHQYTRRINGQLEIAYLRPVLSKPIKRGETINAHDLEMRAFGQYRIPKNSLRAKADIIGKTATTNLRQGAFIASRDVETTKIITKNQLVTLIFNKAGLSLKTQGKAMADGGMNDSISVMNIHSKRIVHGTVKSPGVVVIETPSPVELKKTAQLHHKPEL